MWFFRNPAEPMQRDPAFQRAQRQAAMGFLGPRPQILAANPAMMLFLSRDAGVTVLITSVQMTTRAATDAPAGLSCVDIGALFGISRTHVHALQDVEQVGLVIRRSCSRPGRWLSAKTHPDLHCVLDDVQTLGIVVMRGILRPNLISSADGKQAQHCR
jgi:hypothetical protein